MQDLQLAYDDLYKHLNEYDELTKDLSRIEHIYIKTGLKILSTLKSLMNTLSNDKLSSD